MWRTFLYKNRFHEKHSACKRCSSSLLIENSFQYRLVKINKMNLGIHNSTCFVFLNLWLPLSMQNSRATILLSKENHLCPCFIHIAGQDFKPFFTSTSNMVEPFKSIALFIHFSKLHHLIRNCKSIITTICC